MNGQGRIVLASDATRALLFENDEKHAEVLKLLDEAEEKGLRPLYNILVFATLDYEFLKANEAENCIRLAKLMAKLEATSFLAIPSEEDTISGLEIYKERAHSRETPYIDLICIAMAARLEASFLSLSFASSTLWTLYRAEKLLNKTSNKSKPLINKKEEDIPM